MSELAPAFSSLDFKAALALSTADGTLLIVDASASWCGPCLEMDRTTWSDARTVDWVKRHGLAIQIDVDTDPDLSQELRIEAMPTVLVFKAGKLFDRHVGSLPTEELLTFLDDAVEGKTGLERIQTRVEEAGTAYIDLRYDLFRKLLEEERYAAARGEALWLWRNMAVIAPAMTGVRLSFLVSDLGRLIQAHRPTRQDFFALLAQSEKLIRGKKPDPVAVQDWVALNDLTTWDKELLTRYLAIWRLPGEGQHFWGRRPQLLEKLFQKKQFALAGRAVEDVLEHSRFALAIPDEPEEGAQPMEPEEVPSWEDLEQAVEYVARLYAGCLAADRTGVARDLVLLAGKSHYPEKTLARFAAQAFAAGESLAEHLEWVPASESRLQKAIGKSLAAQASKRKPRAAKKKPAKKPAKKPRARGRR